MTSTRFSKTKDSCNSISGVWPSNSSLQLLLSSGIPSLDILLSSSGGIPVGSVLILRDETKGLQKKPSSIIIKILASRGIYDGHGIFVSSPHNSSKIPDSLPSFEFNVAPTPSKSVDTELQIAWRYQKTELSSDFPKESSPSFQFDFSKRMTAETLKSNKADLLFWTPSISLSSENNLYHDLLLRIHEILKNSKDYEVQSGTKISRVLRIFILDFDSILYGDSLKEKKSFLIALKSLVRNYLAITIIVMDFESETDAMEFGDIVIDLTSFSDEGIQKLFKDYDGFLRVSKLANLHCLISSTSHVTSSKYLYKSYKTKFAIEKMHLPPDLTFGVPSSSVKAPNIDF